MHALQLGHRNATRSDQYVCRVNLFVGASGTLEELEGKSEAELRRLGAIALAEDARQQEAATVAEEAEDVKKQEAINDEDQLQLQAELDRLLKDIEIAERLMPQSVYYTLHICMVLFIGKDLRPYGIPPHCKYITHMHMH